MNKLAQEMSMWGLIFGVVGGLLGWVIAGRMEAGIILKIFTTIATGVAGYVIGWKGESS